MSAAVRVPVTFSGLRTACNNGGEGDVGATNISLSDFYGTNFTDSSKVVSSGTVSILAQFFTGGNTSNPKTFGTGGGGGGGR